ncbi:mucin-3B-like [Penaeus monodon]|uniref:mucin-3B-like n=1 Tax=Penaeus monodon TaxID=6687 RepID=UPI0018A6E0C1|nr:mucin-3B-like [Penaeus monodon]
MSKNYPKSSTEEPFTTTKTFSSNFPGISWVNGSKSTASGHTTSSVSTSSTPTATLTTVNSVKSTETSLFLDTKETVVPKMSAKTVPSTYSVSTSKDVITVPTRPSTTDQISHSSKSTSSYSFIPSTVSSLSKELSTATADMEFAATSLSTDFKESINSVSTKSELPDQYTELKSTINTELITPVKSMPTSMSSKASDSNVTDVPYVAFDSTVTTLYTTAAESTTRNVSSTTFNFTAFVMTTKTSEYTTTDVLYC